MVQVLGGFGRWRGGRWGRQVGAEVPTAWGGHRTWVLALG